jgi:hypothetical protein
MYKWESHPSGRVFRVKEKGSLPLQNEERSLIMLDSESEETVAQPNVKEQVDPEELVKRELEEHPEILEIVEERKKRKFTRSGFTLTLVGIILIVLGLVIHSFGAYILGGFIVGVGALVVIVGIIRILIGLINPIVPGQL